jgi:RNA polymerase sigma factor (sigma-70 family)
MQQPLATQARPSRAHIQPATRPSRAQIEPATRPTRAQIEPAALALLSRHSAGLLATARRYSASPEDAEDAYQRGVEILLTKAPTTAEDELLPWMKTVVKHEAFAVSKASGRSVASEEPLAHQPDERAWTDQRAERYERLRVGAEAMAALKPQEIRCLLLKAEGLSYQEICQATGFSYTKVNRCLTEGRRAFLKRVAGIEAGAECDRLTPLISKLADGEASAEEMRIVRPHLKGCLACKATLREYRAAPGRVAGLVPPVVALTGGGGATAGFLGRLLQAVQERFAALGAGPRRPPRSPRRLSSSPVAAPPGSTPSTMTRQRSSLRRSRRRRRRRRRRRPRRHPPRPHPIRAARRSRPCRSSSTFHRMARHRTNHAPQRRPSR